MEPASRRRTLVRDLARLPVKLPTPEFCRELVACLHGAGLPLVALAFRRIDHHPEQAFASAGFGFPPGDETVEDFLALTLSRESPIRIETVEQWRSWPGAVSWRQAGAESLVGMPLAMEGGAAAFLALGFREHSEAMPAEEAEDIAVQAALVLKLHLAEARAWECDVSYKALFDNAMDAIFLSAPDGTVYGANPAALAMLGRPPGDRAKLSRDNVVAPEDPRLPAALLQRQETGRFFGELTFRRADGSRFPAELSSTVFAGADGLPRSLIIARDISERRAAEQALSYQEGILRSFFNSSSFLMGLVDVEGGDIRHIADNDASARFFGLPAGQIRGRLASELGVPLENIRFWIEQYERSRRGQCPVHFDYEHSLPSGSRWLSATVSHVGPGDGGFDRYSYVVEDVTYRKEAEARAAQLSSMYLALSKTNQAVAFCEDREVLFSDVCAIAITCTGFSAASIALMDSATGKTQLVAYSGGSEEQRAMAELHAAHPLERKQCRKWQAVSKGAPYFCNDWQREAHASCLEASLFPTLRSSAVFPLLLEGKVVAVFSVYSGHPDAFDEKALSVLKEMAAALSFGLANLERENRRRNAEAALRDSQNMLSRVMAMVPLVVYLQDVEEDRILFINQAVEAVTGYSPEEVMAQGPRLIKGQAHPQDSSRLPPDFDRRNSIPEGEFVEYECRISTKDGAWRYLNLREIVIAQVNGQPRQILGVAKDITARVGRQRMEDQKLADFVRMGRLVTLGEMASALAHELNQPLAAITSFAQACLNLLRRGQIDQKELEQALEKTAAQALRAGAVLQTVREFVRKRESHPNLLDIVEAIADVVDLSRIRSRNRQIEYMLALQPDLPPVWADRILVDQVLMNLLRNAEEAMEGEGGKEIQIATSFREEGFVTVSVSDSGLGLPAGFDLDALPAFYTTKADGMGIGLSICRSIIEASGGRVWAESLPSGGAVFRFTLPFGTNESDQRPALIMGENGRA